jgi:hypothetical protein
LLEFLQHLRLLAADLGDAIIAVTDGLRAGWASLDQLPLDLAASVASRASLLSVVTPVSLPPAPARASGRWLPLIDLHR